MPSNALLTVAVATVLGAAPAFARVPASAPAGTTAQCKDGSYSSTATKSGACSGHDGVKKWYGASADAAATAEGDSSAKSAKGKPHKDSAESHAAAASATAQAARPRAGYSTPAVSTGGGNGQVWANKDTKVYHCPGDKWYGKTKQGAYMSESAAVSAGYHADHGKACQP